MIQAKLLKGRLFLEAIRGILSDWSQFLFTVRDWAECTGTYWNDKRLTNLEMRTLTQNRLPRNRSTKRWQSSQLHWTNFIPYLHSSANSDPHLLVWQTVSTIHTRTTIRPPQWKSLERQHHTPCRDTCRLANFFMKINIKGKHASKLHQRLPHRSWTIYYCRWGRQQTEFKELCSCMCTEWTLVLGLLNHAGRDQNAWSMNWMRWREPLLKNDAPVRYPGLIC